MFYSPLFKVFLVLGVLGFLLFICAGCVSNAKRVKIQIPALLDWEVEYHVPQVESQD